MTPLTSTYRHSNPAPTGIPPRLEDSAQPEVHVPGGARWSWPGFLAGQTPNLHPIDHRLDGVHAIRPHGARQHIVKGNSKGILVISPP